MLCLHVSNIGNTGVIVTSMLQYNMKMLLL